MVWWHGPGWGGGPWIGLVWLLFWALLVIGAISLFRRRTPGRDALGSGAAVLAERYARGEIDEHEYRRRLRVLRDRNA
ncbi:MAG TPA: SHOCT domain-containing protein [Actinomycetota bacterium]|nr:SHOCT domain-containing protein [Actinomycetota bacterium]